MVAIFVVSIAHLEKLYCCTPETNVTLYVSYTQIKHFLKVLNQQPKEKTESEMAKAILHHTLQGGPLPFSSEQCLQPTFTMDMGDRYLQHETGEETFRNKI